MTFNKIQSQTLPGALVDLNPPPSTPVDKAGVYVMLSRVRSLDTLWIAKDFPLEVLNSGINPQLLQEEERLRALNRRHTTQYQHQQNVTRTVGTT